VESLLLRAALVERKRFRVYVLEGRPDAGGARSARSYADAGIPTTVVLDSAMGYVMERVDMVLVGAEGVVENGGTVNKVGTFALGVVAREMGVPMYVAAESYKFTRLYPLNNADLPEMAAGGPGGSLRFLDTLAWSGATAETSAAAGGGNDGGDHDGGGTATEIGEDSAGSLRPYVVDLPPSVSIENPPCDFTPAKYITLLFTDLGVLTPSAVSDELIRLYQ
jgi:translation initiation factor eIF-2B subunit alpha